jgi:acyl-coenzyme A thioesterase PaaI-like protein
MAHEDIDFLSAFFEMDAQVNEQGAMASLRNGPHVGNRVGHVQGGITLGLAIKGADAALPGPWRITGLSASFVSPGEGDVLTSHATVIHRGRLTAVVHNRVCGINGRIVLEAISNHTRVVTALDT